MKKSILAIIITITGILIAGCAGPGRTLNQYLYVACEKTGSYGIATFKIHNSGLLTPVTETLVTLLTEITSMVADHQGNRVYVAHNVASSGISIQGINFDTGELFMRPANTIMDIPKSLAIDPSDRYLGCTFNSSSLYNIYKADETLNTIVNQTADTPCGIAFNPLSSCCYITKYYLGGLLILTYDPKDGRVYDTWEAAATISGLNRPVQVVAHPNGRYIYVLNEESTENTISGFKLIGKPDNIQPLSKVSTTLSNLLLVIDPAGRFLYAAKLNDRIINAYGISSETGQLTLIKQIYLDPASLVKSLAVTPNGRFLYVSDIGRNVISMFEVTSDSKVLTPLGADISTMDLWSGRPGVMTTAMKLQ